MSRRSKLIHAIPTKYARVQFRSRLEAQWAGLFDRLHWRWTYEPDLQAGMVIPDFLLDFARPVVIECKPAPSLDEVNEHRRNLIGKMPGWLQDDVLRELRTLQADPDSDPAEALQDLERIAEGQNPIGYTRRVLVVGPQLFLRKRPDRATLDGSHGFVVCTGAGEADHVGLSASLGSHCLVCGQQAEAWVPSSIIVDAWRDVASKQQWKKKR